MYLGTRVGYHEHIVIPARNTYGRTRQWKAALRDCYMQGTVLSVRVQLFALVVFSAAAKQNRATKNTFTS